MVAGQRAGFVKAANLHFASKGDAEGLCAVHISEGEEGNSVTGRLVQSRESSAAFQREAKGINAVLGVSELPALNFCGVLKPIWQQSRPTLKMVNFLLHT